MKIRVSILNDSDQEVYSKEGPLTKPLDERWPEKHPLVDGNYKVWGWTLVPIVTIHLPGNR